jgi:hypothetical protein
LIQEWIAAALLLLIAYALLRWLYIEPTAEPSDPSQEPEPEESA